MIRTWQRGDRAVALGAERHVVDLVAAVVARRHVLRARLDPLDRAAEPLGERQHQHLLAVGLELRAEAAAHVGRDHAQLVLRDAEHAGEDEARDVRDLGGRVERQLVAPGSPIEQRGSIGAPEVRWFTKRCSTVTSASQAGVDVAAADVHSCVLFVPNSPRRAARRPRAPPGPPHRLRVVLDDHVLGGVDRLVPARRHDDRHRVAHVLDLAALERPVLRGLDLDAGRRQTIGSGPGEVARHVLAGQHRHHAVALLGRRGVDRRDRACASASAPRPRAASRAG